MVATILKKVTSQGIEAASHSVSPTRQQPPSTTSINSTINYSNLDKNVANNNLSPIQEDEDNSYLGRLSGYFSDAYSTARETVSHASDEATKYVSSMNPFANDAPDIKIDKDEPFITETINTEGLEKPHTQNWKFFMNDPYNTVTGRNYQLNHSRASVKAVRNLLELVSNVDASNSKDNEQISLFSDDKVIQAASSRGSDSVESNEEFGTSNNEQSLRFSRVGSYSGLQISTTESDDDGKPSKRNRNISRAVTASRLGEGTIRAMRDLLLNESCELHSSLRFWTERLEKPLLYHLEFAPNLIRNNENNHHAIIGNKVSQLQAVLARRCSSIGELQQHLWRAGWQSGVENWGILSDGQWHAVAGTHDSISTDDMSQFVVRKNMKRRKSKNKSYYKESHLFVKNVKNGSIVSSDPALASWSIDAIRLVRDQLYSAGNGAPLPYFKYWPKEVEYFEKGFENPGEANPRLGDSMIINFDSEFVDSSSNDLPLWATYDVGYNSSHNSNSFGLGRNESGSEISILSPSTSQNEIEDDGREPFLSPDLAKDKEPLLPDPSKTTGDIMITDIKMMAAEVNDLLTSMEHLLSIQRRRRLDQLKPPNRLYRNWYIAAIGIPAVGYIAYNLSKGNLGATLAQEVYQKLVSFCSEHISDPLKSIYKELFTKTGREDVTDRKARADVISILQKMIKTWLDEMHPEMPESERAAKATRMDMTLIETEKENSIKNILEINNIYRLSLIEMQFIKKEMMNALFAMDELMGSNEINIKLAAMTPAFLLASSVRYFFRKIFYAFLKIGKSKEETFAQFRHIILDIERLLVMRDNPPLSIPPMSRGVNTSLGVEIVSAVQAEETSSKGISILSSDDLGMLMLLVHECRIILWQDRRRFSRSELRNVSEDLAELAGERGPVSVQQQLRIIARMTRTYSFLKVISSGIPFSVDS